MLLGHCQKESKHAFLKRRCLAVNLDQIRFIEHWHTPRPVEGRASPTRPRGISQRHLAEAVRAEAHPRVLGLRWKSNSQFGCFSSGGLSACSHPVPAMPPGAGRAAGLPGVAVQRRGHMLPCRDHAQSPPAPPYTPLLPISPGATSTPCIAVVGEQELVRGLSLPPSHHQKKPQMNQQQQTPLHSRANPKKVSHGGFEHCGAGGWGWGTAAVPLLQKDARVSLHPGGDGSLRSSVQELHGAGWEKPILGADVYFDFNLRANSECSSYLEIQTKHFSPQIL